MTVHEQMKAVKNNWRSVSGIEYPSEQIRKCAYDQNKDAVFYIDYYSIVKDSLDKIVNEIPIERSVYNTIFFEIKDAIYSEKVYSDYDIYRITVREFYNLVIKIPSVTRK